MDPHDGVPLLLGHVRQHPIPEDSGVVDEHVEVPERFDGLIDQPLGALPVRHVVVVGYGLAAGRGDLVHHLLGRGQVCARAVGVAAEVVDDNFGAFFGEQDGVLPADAPPGAGDDGDATCQRVH